jgi:dolichyl-phosphate beta-glucosyltransferase
VPVPPTLSIIIPARHEAERLPKTIFLLEGFFKKISWSVEVLLIIQGDDETVAIARGAAEADPRFHPIFDTHGKGKGRAVRQGVAAAQGKIILFMDTDLSVPLSSVEKLVEELLHSPHLDILIGSRRLPQSRILIQQPATRRLLSKIFNRTLKLAGLTKYSDTQCGCKLFRHEAAKKIFAQTSIEGFGFDVELLLLAEYFDYKIGEAPIDWADGENSHFRIFRDGIQTLQDIWLLRNKKKSLQYILSS